MGLGACYIAALPFFGNTLVADLVGTAALFGLDSLVQPSRNKSTLPAVGEPSK
jgi:hypothetical protein